MKGNIMLKTKKMISKKLAANQVVVTVQEAISNVLSANLNVFYVTRDQGRKVWVALGTSAGNLAAHNLRVLKNTVAAANDKSVAAWDAVEQALDERVMPVLEKVGLASPAQFGVDLFGKGLHRVSAQVVELTLERRMAAKRTVSKPVAKKVVVAKRRVSSAARKAA
jgi:hypothetical protein